MSAFYRSPVAAAAALIVLSASAASAQNFDGGIDAGRCSPDGGGDAGCLPGGGTQDADLTRELEKALQQDAPGRKKSPAGTSNDPLSVPDAAVTPTRQDSTPARTARSQGFQSLNPDLSVIIDANAGYERRTPSFRNSLDPILRSKGDSPAFGPAVQEVEVAASAIVDPYFKGELYLSIPNLNALEVEEGFVTTTSLPWSLQVKVGTFRSAFGRQNGQHTHVQDFTQRPLFYTAFLGEDGFRGPGIQVSWLAPLPFFLTLYAEVFDLPLPAPGSPVATFGGGSGTDLSYATEAKVFIPVTDEWSAYGGISAAIGVSPSPSPVFGVTTPVAFDRRSLLVAADLYLKWKPLNVTSGYNSLAWQSEVVFRRLGEPRNCSSGGEAVCGAIPTEWDGGLYTQVVYQLSRRWFVGIRGDLLGIPASHSVPTIVKGSTSITFTLSEFARLRLHGELEHTADVATLGAPAFSLVPAEVIGASPRTSFATYLQLEVAMGAHGAHPF